MADRHDATQVWRFAVMALNVLKVWSPQTLDTTLAGPGPSNRLFILTGIAEVDWRAPRNNRLAHNSVELVLSDWHEDIKDIHLDEQATKLAAVAWPASMNGNNDADQVTFAAMTLSLLCLICNGRSYV
jgi:hypothetical protein